MHMRMVRVPVRDGQSLIAVEAKGFQRAMNGEPLQLGRGRVLRVEIQREMKRGVHRLFALLDASRRLQVARAQGGGGHEPPRLFRVGSVEVDRLRPCHALGRGGMADVVQQVSRQPLEGFTGADLDRVHRASGRPHARVWPR